MSPNGGGVSVTHGGLPSRPGTPESQEHENLHSAGSANSGETAKKSKGRKQPRKNVSGWSRPSGQLRPSC